jgi:Mycothiol maleylpyruvate isomerase N-terminal domain
MTLQDKRDELLEHYRQSIEELKAAIEDLSEAQMVEPSIDGWSVKDNLAHVAFWHNLRAEEIGRISAGHATTWRISGEEDERLNAIVHNARRDLPLDQALWELENTRQRLLHALAYATDRGLDPSLYGEAGLRSNHELEHARYIREWREKQGL